MMLDKNEIRNSLKMLDDSITLNFNCKHFEIAIIGGASFILRNSTSRQFTRDIDGFRLVRKQDGSSFGMIENIIDKVNEKLEVPLKFDINSKSLMFSGILEYEKEWVQLFVDEFDNFSVFIPSLEMSVLLKIYALGSRNSDNDELDIFNKNVLEKINFKRLYKYSDIWLTYMSWEKEQFKIGLEYFNKKVKQFKSE